ncbi:MAG: 2-C-methyl-D-erythritol 2,4-cyclodiphosphate synthase [Treponema sp.]|nr:2-C-methyl-D-erythritol 2,4-cyclodiphosphate synthase [Treponema sp.]MCI7567246.1 2-C-methyl-D-erythritol 2,4-cyclodiphosphate synthase [Treponema sp.]
MIRVGLGYDLHRLVEGRKLIIGGVDFPFEKGEDGHSDGDVLLHAVTDALLGASGLGDIGSYFPPEDPKWKNADSAKLLQAVWKDVLDEGWKLENLDCVVKLEKPKFLPKRQEVISSIAKILGVENERVFVKAKTGEKLPPVGTGDAIEAYVVCLLNKAD